MQIKKIFHTDHYIATYTTDETHEGMRLDAFALLFYPLISREKIKKKIKAKELLITNRKVANKPSSKIKEGDIVQVTIYRSIHEDEYWNGEKVELEEKPEIVYEDQDLIAMSKPPFMSTHPTGRHLFYCATVYFESRDEKTIHSVHRLDRETSGILLLARNPKTAQKVTLQFEQNRVKKCYFFIAHNQANNTDDTFECHLRLGQEGRDLRSRVCVNAYPQQSTQGKHASTDFKILYRDTKYVLGLAFPLTGRQHQIRAHAQQSGYPLVGDKIYHGGYEMFQHFKDGIATPEEHQLMQIPRHALHAIAITLPYNNQRLSLQTPFPHDLKEWIIQNIPKSINEIETLFSQEIKQWFQSFSN